MVNTLNSKVRKSTTGRKVLHSYTARGGCKTMMESRASEVLISGPAGTGKSRGCLEKIYAMCMLTPNTRGLILRKTLASLGSSALQTWRKYVIAEALATGQVVYYGGSAEEPPQYRFKNGSTVVIGGLDKAIRIMSTEYDIIYIQEATECTIDDIEMCTSRLRNWTLSFQQLLMDCNPAGDKHWLLLRSKDGTTQLIESRHEDNPMLFDELPDGTYRMTKKGEKYLAILDKLTGVRYLRLRLGKWVSAEGIVYEEFDVTKHVLLWDFDEEGNRLPLPAEWERYWTIDFGYKDPFVLKCYAVDEFNIVYMYREIYFTERLVSEHAQQIMDIVCPETTISYWDHMNRVERTITKREWIEPQPVAVICDHDAEGRATFTRDTGIGTTAAQKAIKDGIDTHKARLKGNEEGPLFFLMADALVERDQQLMEKLRPTCTQDEYSCYQWKVGSDGRTKDEPVDKDNHGMDTDRYLSMHLDFKGKPRVTMLDLFENDDDHAFL